MPTVDLNDLEPVDETDMARQGQLGTLSAGNPSWTDRLAGGFSNAVGWLGATPQGQQNAYQFAQTGAPLVPGVGQVLSGNEAYRGLQQGNYGQAALGALGAIPIPGASVEGRAIGALAKEAEPLGGRIAMEGGTPGLLAYHGSRHDFPSFDINKIGAGEGAQVYGHGLYFAEHPDVAQSYRTAGGGDATIYDPQGNVYTNPPYEPRSWERMPARDKALWYMTNVTPGMDLHHVIDMGEGGRGQAVHDAADQLINEGWTTHRPEGYKYQVGIGADPEKFFDLDANFKDQHPDVQEALNDLAGRKFPNGLSGNEIYDHLIDRINKFPEDFPSHWDQVQRFGNQADPHVGLAWALDESGIPGIRYFDEGSRPYKRSFGKTDLLMDYPQDVQDKIMKMHPDINPKMSLNDIHNTLHRQAIDDGGGILDEANMTKGHFDDTRDRLIKAGAKLPPQTRNYVIFSDKNIDILKKWGAGGALLVGGTGAASAQDFYKNHPDLDRHSLEDADGG